MTIDPAPVKREWMELGNAKRCLPLLIANQCGWQIKTQNEIEAEWNGGFGDQDIRVVDNGGSASSHFGYGILTFNLPYLFVTPKGWNLRVSGPINEPKDGIHPLEGIVETDWTAAAFTMNWKFTRPGKILFAKGEPVCQISPIPDIDFQNLQPEIYDIGGKLEVDFRAWRFSRTEFNNGPKIGWQKDYFQGKHVLGEEAHKHKTTLNVQKFVDRR
jgi:hypothetical protein